MALPSRVAEAWPDARLDRCRRCGGWADAALAEVLAPGGFDQAVDGVVGVVVARLDALVAEEDGLLRVVADMGDVARRVVGVVQVLHPGSRAMPTGGG